MKRLIKGFAILATLFMTGFGLTACTSGTTPDMCAYTQGTGTNGADAKVHDIYLPGEQFTPGSEEKTFYFPCNSRNLRLTEGSTDVHADGSPVGPIEYYTPDGTKAIVRIRMDWMLNQNDDVLRNTFIPWCAKYQCASTDSAVRNDNFSTDGWSKGFLGENAVPAFETSARDGARAAGGNSPWDDPDAKEKISAEVSKRFMTAIRGTMGSTSDLFCGSGETSGWSDPSNPGKDGTTFNCAPVRVTVEDVQPFDRTVLELGSRKAKADKEKAANEAELAAAKAKYGPNAGEVLGDLDRIKACKEAGERCNVYVGNKPTQ